MSAKRVSRELHDAFENDIEIDISQDVLVAEETATSTEEEKKKRDSKRELIERVRPSEMLPDRFQPRPVLPIELHQKLFRGELDCYQAAAEWVRIAKKDKGNQRRVDELVDMAESVDDHGQIKPITGSWKTTDDGSYIFMIETGERRFWGACLKKILDKSKDEPMLRVDAIEAPTIERQIVENRHAQPPSIVAQAREISALILKKMGYVPDQTLEDPYDYFRMVIDLPGRKRLPKGIWNQLESIMQLSPRRMRQVVSVLHMPTELLEQADRYNLSYRVIQAILNEPTEMWERLINIAIEESLTGEELSKLSEIDPREVLKKRRSAKQKDYSWSALRGLRGFSGAVLRAGVKRRDEVLGTTADEIVIQENASEFLGLLDELASLVRTRLKALEEIEERK